MSKIKCNQLLIPATFKLSIMKPNKNTKNSYCSHRDSKASRINTLPRISIFKLIIKGSSTHFWEQTKSRSNSIRYKTKESRKTSKIYNRRKVTQIQTSLINREIEVSQHLRKFSKICKSDCSLLTGYQGIQIIIFQMDPPTSVLIKVIIITKGTFL